MGDTGTFETKSVIGTVRVSTDSDRQYQKGVIIISPNIKFSSSTAVL